MADAPTLAPISIMHVGEKSFSWIGLYTLPVKIFWICVTALPSLGKLQALERNLTIQSNTGPVELDNQVWAQKRWDTTSLQANNLASSMFALATDDTGEAAEQEGLIGEDIDSPTIWFDSETNQLGNNGGYSFESSRSYNTVVVESQEAVTMTGESSSFLRDMGGIFNNGGRVRAEVFPLTGYKLTDFTTSTAAVANFVGQTLTVNLQKYDSELLIDNINKLYDTFKENKNIIDLINNNPYKNQLMNDFLIFQTYFSFNTLDVFHKCLQDIKNKNSISENNKEELLKAQDEYYENVNKWFIEELGKWSKKHNMYVEDYVIARFWVIGSEETHEPYSHHRDKDLDEQFEEAFKDYQQLIEDLHELGITCWQGLEYSEEHKFLH